VPPAAGRAAGPPVFGATLRRRGRAGPAPGSEAAVRFRGVDVRRLRIGELVLAAAGGLLLASLFLPWYGAADGTLTAYQSLALLDVVLALIALSALSLLPITAAQRVPAVPIAPEALVPLAGIVAVILVLFRVLWLPDAADGREWALWLALAGAAGIVVGGLVGMRDERPSPPGRHLDSSGRPMDAAHEIETIPAPRAERA
jgi:hypothetical protein